MAIATAPAAAAEYYFRYNSTMTKTDVEVPEPEPEYGLGNDIHAYYVAPIGHAFSKRIPVTTTDVVSWKRDDGIWPEGIALDTATGLMSGSPTSVERQALLYHGYDAQGHKIARARLSFTTFRPVGAGRELNLYAHTGQYLYADIPLPSGLNVYRWESVDALPPGISMLGNAVQGIPEKAGTYGVAWRGFDYLGREIAFVHGELLVQDGPVVETVADQSVAKDAGQTFNVAPVVQHKIGSLKFNLVAEGAQPPGLDVDRASGRTTGVYPTFDTSASYHYVVTDTADGTQQKSNTFKLSTLPAAVNLASMPDLSGSVKAAFSQPLSVPNLQPGAEFVLKAGSWPDGISMDASTGLISGTPTKAEIKTGLIISVSGPSMTTAESRAFKFSVYPEAIAATFTPLSVRVGTPFSTAGAVVTKGGVAPLSFAAAENTTIAPGLTLDPSNGEVSSSGLQTPGEYSASLVITNGDGQASKPIVQQINAFNPLSISYAVSDTKRLKPFLALAAIADDSIIGTAKYSVDSGSLPGWMKLDARTGSLSGTPVAADTVTTYPPFEIALSDDTGETAHSGPITITVSERDELAVDLMNSEVERFISNQRLSFRAVNAYKQPKFELVQGKLGIDPQSTLALTEDGYLVGSTKDPVGTVYGNLVVRVSDADNASKDTAPFSLTVVEPSDLAPLTGSLDIALTWAKDVPFSGIMLPELANGHGIPVYAFSTAAPGIVFNAQTREVSGVASATGTFEYAYTIDDETDRPPATGKVTLNILDPITISGNSSYAGSVGEPLSIKPTVSNGIAPVQFIFTGSLPKGLEFANGAVSGRPRVEGEFGPFTISVKDLTGTSVDTTFGIVVGPAAPLNITWGKGPFTVGRFGSVAPTTSGVIGTLKYKLAPASILPPGTSLQDAGTRLGQLAGTPTEAGRFRNISIEVTDTGYDAAASDDRTLTVPVELWVVPDGDIELGSTTLKVRAGKTFTTDALSPKKAVSPLTYSASSPTGLPYDLVLNPATGALTGKFEEPGTFGGIEVNLEDDLARTASATLSIEVTPKLEVSAPADLAFRQYSTVLSPVVVSNPVGKITYAMSAGSPALPPGLYLDAATGQIKGEPETTGSMSGYVIVATDDGDASTAETNPFSITISPRLPLDITAPASIATKQHAAISASVATQHAVGSVTYTVAPDLPHGIVLDKDTGEISGSSGEVVPEAVFTVTAVDSKGGATGTDTASFSLAVALRDPLGFEAPDSHVFPQYFDDEVAPTAENVIGTARWSITPALPTWATFDAASGKISVLAEEKSDPQVYALTLTDDHDSITQNITLSVGDRRPLEITDADILLGIYDRDLDLPLSVKNAVGDVVWTFGGGTLPEGLEFDAVGGSFTGHPTEFGQFPGITILVSDEKGGQAQKTFMLDVQENGTDLLLSALPSRKTHLSSTLSGELPTTTNGIGKLSYSATGLSGSGLGIDTATGEIRGRPSSTGSVTAVIKVTDGTKREATAPAIIEVLPDVTVSTPSETIEVVYNRDPSDSPRPVANNAVPDLAWTLKSGTLPKGLTIDARTGALAGRAKQIGAFGPFTVEVVDGVGGTGGRAISAPMWLHVEMNDDPIELSVADYTAYVGSVINTTAPTFDNELGTVTFFSPDVAALGLTINPQTGVISGIINELTDAIINVSIKDSETLRVTSRPLHLQVFPELRLTYPAVVNATQAVPLSQNASLGYNIGTVTFSKGQGSWPAGFELNTSTGAITATEVTAEAKTYPDLTVIAHVVFNGGQTNSQPSNTFAIKVNPVQALPVISNIPGNRMVFGTVDTAATAFTPTVVDSVKGKPWVYAGTVYSLNHNLAADTGLTFDASTGRISGTPTKAVIYRDLTITVTSSQGDKASTAPFWFGVSPKGPIVARANQKTLYKWRKGQPAQTDAPIFDNWIGNPLFSLGIATGVAFDANTGILSTGSLPFTASSSDLPVTLTDEFGRKATFTYRVEVLDALTITTLSQVAIAPGGTLTNANVPTVARLYGSASYAASGLPAWATLNPATGSISGTAPIEDEGKSFPVVLTVTDSYDGHSRNASYTLSVRKTTYYRLLVDTWIPHPTSPQCVGLAELRVMSGSTDITSASVVTVSSETPPYYGSNLTNGTAAGNAWFSETTGPKFVTIDPQGQNITSMVMMFRTDGAQVCTPLTWRVQTSPDKDTWTTQWSDSLPSFRASWTTEPR
jgi:hypothetical protein